MEIENLTTANTELAVSLIEAKKWCRIDIHEDDIQLIHLIKSATKYIEDYTNRCFFSQTFTRYLDSFPRQITLSRYPILDVTSIKYLDTASPNAQQTLASTVYRLDKYNGYIHLNDAQTWPTHTWTSNSIEVAYRAGYRDTAASPISGDIPDDLKHAVLVLVEHFYDYRAPVVESFRIHNVPFNIEMLLHKYQLYGQ